MYLYSYEHIDHAREGLAEYFPFYNRRRPHSALGMKPPAELYHGSYEPALLKNDALYASVSVEMGSR
ncbi:transposase [Candidatus Uhrbacteria bacterium]|nr:transposase [Candidatus Uhrbacteria bacterium]